MSASSDYRISLGMALFLLSLIAADLALLRFTFTSESQLTGVAFGTAMILTGALLGAGIGFIIVGRRGAELGAIAGAAVPVVGLAMVIAMMALR